VEVATVTLPLAAGGATADTLVDLFVVLLAAKIGDEVFKRIGQPTIVGEILAGVVVGPAVLGLVEVTSLLEVFAELGVVFLLFWVGLETRITDLRTVGPSAARTGVLGVVLPFAAGFGLGLALGESRSTSMFLGAARGGPRGGRITSAVLIELGALGSRAGRTIIGAAIVDDILAMLILAVAVGIAAGGADVLGIAVVVALALAFVGFFALGGTAVTRRWPGLLKAPRFSESPLLPAVILCLGLAALAAEIGLAAIIGAFLAGMIVAETKEQHPVEDEVVPLYAFFPPFFFVYIGMQIDLGSLADPGTIALLAGVTALAALTKYVGAWVGARGLGAAEARFVGVGMVPRGEVGIIVAGIGKASGVVGTQMFAVVVGMSVLTTLLVPPVLRHVAKGMPEQEPDAAG
jgi:Kef-type K+ transport system membrane component KefB